MYREDSKRSVNIGRPLGAELSEKISRDQMIAGVSELCRSRSVVGTSRCRFDIDHWRAIKGFDRADP
jgi:hypothetical protein